MVEYKVEDFWEWIENNQDRKLKDGNTFGSYFLPFVFFRSNEMYIKSATLFIDGIILWESDKKVGIFEIWKAEVDTEKEKKKKELMAKYPALTPIKNEPEYKKDLPISSANTEKTEKKTKMPYGSAILTDTGNSKLKNNGITHIIHAAMMSQGSNEELFIKKAVLALQNSIILADRQEFTKLATPFLAGGIYCNKEETKPLLAEALIIGAINQLEKCSHLKEVILVDFDDDYFKNAYKKVFDGEENDKIKVVKGNKDENLLHKSLHGAEVIINSENAEMEFRGGISGTIKKELGKEAGKIDQQRKNLMKKFNSGEKENEEDISLSNPDKGNNYLKYSLFGAVILIVIGLVWVFRKWII